jgi:ATP-dependent DNA helicase RecG
LGHRDYRSTSHVQVNVFRDRVEVWSPGGLVSGLRLKDLGRVSRPRNLLIFSLMARMDLVEHIGSGIKRIRESVAAYGLEAPLIETDGDWFSITFMRKSPHDAIERLRERGKGFTPPLRDDVGGVNGGVSEGVSGLLEFIKRTPGLRTPQISKAMDVPAKTLEKWLRKLKDRGDIEFKGSPKTGGYRKKESQGEG